MRLEQCEQEVENAERNGYLGRGRALAEIRDSKLYRERYQTFEEYCERRWELTPQHAGRLMAAASFAAKLEPIGSIPVRETHVRPLLTLDNDEAQLSLWREVLDGAGGHPRDIRAADVENAVQRFTTKQRKPYMTLDEWNDLHPDLRFGGNLQSVAGKEGLNRQTNADIEWANWSWNPVTGCLHGCPYCYARDIAVRVYPDDLGFAPAIWPERLAAPIERRPPGEGADKNIFVCSMADLFGRWVPRVWIEEVLQTVEHSPQWNFLFLTKFPNRMSEFEIPGNAWVGTTVDLQARVANAEKAMSAVKAPVRWLSLEPMLEPLRFKRLDMFDWIVIGGASESKAVDGTPATPEWSVPIDWIIDIHQQARAAGCAVYYKTNSGLTGTTRLREYPGAQSVAARVPPVFDYLRAMPKAERIG